MIINRREKLNQWSEEKLSSLISKFKKLQTPGPKELSYAKHILHISCSKNYVNLLAETLKVKNIDVNKKDSKGNYALMIAYLNCSIDCIELLIKDSRIHIIKNYDDILSKYHEVEAECTHDQMKSFQIIQTEYRKRFAELLKQLTIGQINNRRDNLLYEACIENNFDAVSQLLKVEGIDVNVRMSNGETPYMCALKFSSIECIELLLKDSRTEIFQWAVDNTVDSSTKKGRYIKHMIRNKKQMKIDRGKVEKINLLVEYIKSFDHSNVTKVLEKMNNEEVNECDPYTELTPLHVAAALNNYEAVRKLLNFEKIKINAKLKIGKETPLFVAFKLYNVETLELLIYHSRLDLKELNRLVEVVITDSGMKTLKDINFDEMNIRDKKITEKQVQDTYRLIQEAPQKRKIHEESLKVNYQKDSSDINIVVDTCILLNNLSIVKDIAHNRLKDGQLIRIPWIVLQELDKHKDRRNTHDNLQGKARAAGNWIYDCLSQNTKSVRGQNTEEEKIAAGKFTAQCPDDKILQFCLYLRDNESEQKKRRKVILLTNDINLSSKALIHDIYTAKHDKILQKLEEVKKVQGRWMNN